MVGVKISCSAIRDKVLNHVVEQIKESCVSICPKMGIIRCANQGSISYVNSLSKTCDSLKLGFEETVIKDPRSLTDFTSTLVKLNNDPSIHGIMVVLPTGLLNLHPSVLFNRILYWKDIEGMGKYHYYHLMNSGFQDFIVPCTAAATICVIEQAGCSIRDCNITVIGSGITTGRPVYHLLKRLGANATMCYPKGSNFKSTIPRSNIIIACDKLPYYLHEDLVQQGAGLIDFGSSVNVDNFDTRIRIEPLLHKLSWYVNEPDGIGQITSAWACLNLVECFKRVHLSKTTPFLEQVKLIMGPNTVNFF